MPILKSKTSQESPFKIFYYNNRGIRKVHGQVLSMKALFSPTIHGAKFLPTGLKNVPMVIFCPFGTNVS